MHKFTIKYGLIWLHSNTISCSSWFKSCFLNNKTSALSENEKFFFIEKGFNVTFLPYFCLFVHLCLFFNSPPHTPRPPPLHYSKTNEGRKLQVCTGYKPSHDLANYISSCLHFPCASISFHPHPHPPPPTHTYILALLLELTTCQKKYD